MKTVINKFWLLVAYFVETLQLDPAERKLRLMERRHSIHMDELRTMHARELEREEAVFSYNHHMLGLRMDWLWRKIEILREYHNEEYKDRRRYFANRSIEATERDERLV